MGQALYRKYRSKSLDEIVGQEHITGTLSKALADGRISHAYLFTGPRGVGKTSIARILAHAINELPYDEAQSHLDIIEIDAASNRRIDEIRDLRDKVHTAPASAKYKVYIIDEVHMLTKEAFNALLKTLEEPPEHAVFILATTESHKLPATIVSRTQRYIFRPIETAKAIDHLRSIAAQEDIIIDDAALDLLARHGDGSFRDSISLLDQVASLPDAASETVVRMMLGLPSAEAMTELLNFVEAGSTPDQLIGRLNDQYEHGIQATAIATQLAALVRQRIINGSIDTTWATAILSALLEVGTVADPERYLEIVLIRQATKHVDDAPSGVPRPQPVAAAKPDKPSTVKPSAKTAPAPKPTPEIKPEPTAAAVKAKPLQATPKANSSKIADEATWSEVLVRLKKDYNTLYGIVRMAKPDFGTPGEISLAFAFAFHQKRAKEAKNLQAISDAVEAVYGQTFSIHCSHDPDLKLAQPAGSIVAAAPVVAAAASGTAPLDDISNIFGDAEVLE